MTTLPRRHVAQRLAYVPQGQASSFPFSVREIVSMGRTLGVGLGRPLGAADRQIVAAALDRLGMGALAERPYAEMSGGERQAVIVARALAQGARFLIMDEPAAALDLGQQIRLMRLLASLAVDGFGIVATTHQPDHVLRWFNRAILLQHGRVAADGAPADVLTDGALSDLYGAPVHVVDGRFVVPGATTA